MQQSRTLNCVGRRDLMAVTLTTSVIAAAATAAEAQTTQRIGTASRERRRLGDLVVSSIGLSVQNMHRTYQTTIPYRPEMLNIVRGAYDHGVTFFDTAEAYGPFENERILGEAAQPFRNKVVIASKFGWNVDPETGRRLPGLNSRPDHIRRRWRVP